MSPHFEPDFFNRLKCRNCGRDRFSHDCGECMDEDDEDDDSPPALDGWTQGPPAKGRMYQPLTQPIKETNHVE